MGSDEILPSVTNEALRNIINKTIGVIEKTPNKHTIKICIPKSARELSFLAKKMHGLDFQKMVHTGVKTMLAADLVLDEAEGDEFKIIKSRFGPSDVLVPKKQSYEMIEALSISSKFIVELN